MRPSRSIECSRRTNLQGVHKGAERLDTALGPIYLTFLEARAS
jgi:hypothetical protein